MESTILRSGLTLRWLNNAGFEVILPSGKHLFVDPWLDNADIFPVTIASIDRMDYVLLTHIHYDHADSIANIQNKFPEAKIFVGDLSADPLCEYHNMNVEKIFRMRGGEVYEFDDVKIEAISGRHTESRRGNYRNKGENITVDGSLNLPMWYGWLDFLNYRITASDGSTAVVWGGMTTEEQIHRMAKYANNDIAFMHVSPKQDSQMFGRLASAINSKVVIPHHYDLWDSLFAAKPELLKDSPIPPEKMNEKYILGLIKDSVEESCPYATFFIPEHHKWYRFGLAVSGNA